MALKTRKPPGGPAEQLSWNFVATNYTPRDTKQAKKKQAAHRPRTNFARAAVFEMFPYRDARAIDYGKFLDRKPNQSPRPSPSHAKMLAWWAP